MLLCDWIQYSTMINIALTLSRLLSLSHTHSLPHTHTHTHTLSPISLSLPQVNRAKGTDKQSLLLQMGKVGEEVDSALKKMRVIQVQ